MKEDTDAVPTIAFVVATLNEEAAIEACLRSLLDQQYPHDRIEVAVADGGSSDRTCALVAAMAADDPRVQLHHNPRRIAASAFNIGIAATKGDIVSLVSAHSTTDPGYAAVLAEAFATSGAALVGGRKIALAPDAGDATAEAIVLATSSPLGLGSARYHYSEEPGWVDTAFPGAYRRELLAEIGGFDESLVRNQDDELHLRAALAGYPMWYEPRLRSSYHPRHTLRALWRQYFEYGWWRSVTIRKHHHVSSPRQLAPAALVAGLVGGPLVAAAAPRTRLVAVGWLHGVVAWLVVLALAGWRERALLGWRAPRVSAAVACLHLSYGTGFWSGVLSQLRRRGPR